MKWLWYLWSNLRHDLRFTLTFSLNLALGLVGLISVHSFKSGFEDSLAHRSRAIMGADLSLSARRPITEAEEKLLPSVWDGSYEKSSTIEFFSMVANPEGSESRLLQLRVIDEGFPFYGEIKLSEESDSQIAELHDSASVWVYPEVLLQLNRQIGDSLRVGEALMTIRGVVIDDAAATITTSMAPRLYLGRSQLAATELLRDGSVASHSLLYKLAPEADLEELEKKISARAELGDLQVRSHDNSSSMMARMNGYLSDFLGLTGLAALFLTAIGGAFLFRAHLQYRLKELAILVSLGLSRTKALWLVCAQLVFLGLLGSLVAVLLSLAVTPVINYALQGLVPTEVSFGFQWSTLLLALLIGSFAGLLFGLPFVYQITRLKPASLLSNAPFTSRISVSSVLVGSLPSLSIFWLLSMWQAQSYRTGSVFFGLMLGVAILLGFCSLQFFKWIPRLLTSRNLSLNWALRDIERFRLSSVSAFLALSLGMVLLNLIPQLQSSLDQELEAPESSKLPSLFLFDIQQSQVEELKRIVESEKIQLESLSSMIRARLLRVNGEDFERDSDRTKALTREQKQELRFRSRGFNLTYREGLSDAEELVKGEPLADAYDEASGRPAEISVEENFAKRLGFQVGDELVFSIQGIEIPAVVKNLRKVRWASFQPNFFVVFQPGVLEEAPQNFLATLPHLGLKKKNRLQNKIVKALPNVSLVDISRIVEGLRGVVGQMSIALQGMALLCVLAGLFVIFAIANHQANSRRWDIGLLKSLGASWALIRSLFILQNVIIGVLAGLLGVAVSFALSYGLSYFLFDGVWALNWKTPLGSLALMLILVTAVSYLGVRQALATKARDLLS